MERKIKILYIDDEPNNLFSFKATFRREYEVLTASSSNEALDQLALHPDINIIISDQRMPGKTGVQFFEEIRAINPAPVRMLCTGFTDVEAIIDSINKGQVFRYIQKPWSETDIRLAIEEAYSYYIAASLLAQKHNELLKANAELDKFAHSVTHELRSPIMSVIGGINLAKMASNIKEVHELLDLINMAMIKLDSFIYNIHDYYTIKRGELHFREIDFKEMLKSLKDIYDLNGKTNNINFIISTHIEGPFISDETAVNIIINNLLSNAFKYQRKDIDHKEVILDIAVSNNIAAITVTDNGIGIQEEYLNNIFDMFYRATKEEFGSGFGLYNVKDALDKLNGEIKVSSQRNEGTIFKLTIPGYNGTA